MKILIISSIDSETINRLSSQHDVVCAFSTKGGELKDLLKDCEVLIFRSGTDLSADTLASANRLRALIRAGSGTDNVDLEYVYGHSIRLETIPEPGARAVAEMAFALMLALSRNIVVAHQSLSKGLWIKSELQGHLITGKKLGIVGLGRIGLMVAELGAAWGMRPIACVKRPTQERVEMLRLRGIQIVHFDEVVAESDILSLHVPLNDSTFHLINSEVLSRMKAEALLINLARGGVVDEKALFTALTEKGRPGGAALDVHEHEGSGKISPLAGLPNVVLTPHIGAMAAESQREIGRRTVEIVDSIASANS